MLNSKLMAATALGLAGVLATADSAKAELIYGLTTDNNIFSFDSATPSTILSGQFISGLQNNESLVGIDFRPSNGLVYGVGSTSRVYTINPTTGVATPVSTTAFVPTLNGTSFDIDFNPVPDAIRLVSDADQNLRISPNTGALISVDGTISYGTAVNPNLAGAAYTNNVVGATTTTLYTIDAGIDQLNIQTPPNNGTQVFVATLKDSGGAAVDVSGLLGFDISGLSATAYVALQQSGNGYSQFSAINLATGILTGVSTGSPTSGLIGGGLFVRDITAVPEPVSLGVAGLAVAGLLARRRRA